MQDTEEYQQEVRLAVVVYGGVSLSIYINGVVQEMLNLVRATAPGAKANSPLLIETLKGSEIVYRKLGKLLGHPDRTPAELNAALDVGAPEPVSTRFVIDIISGTSAGGINAVFLGKALANNEPLESLQSVWLDEGDVDRLLNDHGTELLPPNKPPRSLLNGPRMYQKLLQALDAMDAPRPAEPANALRASSPLVEDLDLFCTATDLEGVEVHLPLTDRHASERKFKAVFQFRYAPDLPPLGELPAVKGVNDFGPEDNAFLAFAARCTSSFPFAFEPMTLADIYPTLSASAKHRHRPYALSGNRFWQRFYESYSSETFERRAFADGGYLDNKPFSYAIDTILARDAEMPVVRKLVYIEPDPEADPGRRSPRKLDAVSNILLAATALPRYEGIREDLEVVLRRNQQLERLKRVFDAMAGRMGNTPASGADTSHWLESTDRAPDYEAYERLKISSVTDDLTELVAKGLGISLTEREGVALRLVIGRWRDSRYQGLQCERQFLLDFDLPYRTRRLRDVSQFIDDLYRTSKPAIVERNEYRAELLRLRKALRTARGQLRAVHRQASTSVKKKLAQELRAELAWVLDTNAPRPARVGDDPSRPRPETVARVGQWSSELDRLCESVRKSYRGTFEVVSAHVKATLQRSSPYEDVTERARREVRERYETFEARDVRWFPIGIGTNFAEGRTIAIHRISPADAITRRLGEPKGLAVANFGAFLDISWREHDILLGRLNGSERLIRILLHGSPSQGSKLESDLVEQAHEAIVHEFLDLIKFEKIEDWNARLQRFCSVRVHSKPEVSLVETSVARAITIVGKLFSDLAERRNWRYKYFCALAFFGRTLWTLWEVWRQPRLSQVFMTLLGLAGVLCLLAAALLLNRASECSGTVVAFGAVLLGRSLLGYVVRDARTRTRD